MDAIKNEARFTGFANLYDNVRPAVPVYPVETIVRYMGYNPVRVVDLGCGTGLSTQVWKNHCTQVIGVEPNSEMLSVAQNKASDKIRFISGFGHQTNLGDDFADVVVCSQSFHWMEPTSTLKEVDRILKKGGAFATIDCDWPPVSVWKADNCYDILHERVHALEKELPEVRDAFVRYDKEKHITNIQKSGYFRYARELVFANAEVCSPERFIGLLLSQGGVQAINKFSPKLLEKDIAEFKNSIHDIFEGQTVKIDFSYRMRLAIK